MTLVESYLQAICPLPLDFIWHENMSVYLSMKKEKGRLKLRLHRLFQEAPTPVLEALIRMALNKDKTSRVVVRKMAHLYFLQNRGEPKILSAQGQYFDLQAIYERLKAQYFSQNYQASIGWSERSQSGKFRFITFGTFDRHRSQIRINPLLDDPEVPLHFVEFIVYHEMLHGTCASKFDAAGRCRVHTAEFRRKEREFPLYKEAKEWERGCLKFFKNRKKNGRS